MGETSLRLGGLHCAACEGLIEQALARTEGVTAVRVNAAARRATVHWDPQRTRVDALLEAVRRAGYSAAVDALPAAAALRRDESRLALWRLFVAGFCMMQVMMLAAPAYFAAPGEIAPDLQRLLHWGAWVLSLPVLLFSAAPFFGGAWRALQARRIGMDVPVALGIAVTFVASSAAAFDPAGTFGAAVYFDSLTMFVAFLLGGRWFEMRVRHRAEAAFEAALGALPPSAQRLRDDGSDETVPVQRLVPGDRVRVPLGQAFPADGVLIDGPTEAAEALLSGESRPLAKTAGDTLLAGSVNVGRPVCMRVERTGADTRYEAVVALVREAASQRPASARWADRWAAPFLWAVLALAALAAAAWSVIDPSRAVWVAVSVLIVTCPCALSLATPSALLAACGALARRGVLVRRPDALEALAGIDRLCIDKTGTLTTGRPRLQGVTRLPGDGPDEAVLLQRAARLAAWSAHPLSLALVDAVPGAGHEDEPWQQVREQAGEGLEATDADGQAWRLGRAAWVGADAAAVDAEHQRLWFGPVGRPLLCIAFDEALREDAAAAVAALRADGVAVALLSGDSPQRVERIARQLAVDEARGGARPDDKLALVRAAQQAGQRVAMVGDGINDAPVLAQADVSLAMGAGALLARASADAVIVSDRLSDVVHARRLAQRMLRVIRQNIAWAAGYNALCVPLALLGALPPWAAGLGMAASSLFVIGNAALRLGR